MDEYLAVGLRHQANSRSIDRALSVVEKYLIKRKLILYGGRAIDFALRLLGQHLYSDAVLPDYDFYSPDNVGDAYALAQELHALGLPNVSVVTALHVQTMRVRVDFETVADVSYMPPVVFERVATLSYQNMRFLHPHWIRMDQHLAFCFPFNGFPREDVFHRFEKDLTRFNLLAEAYPFPPGAPPPVPRQRITLPDGIYCGFTAHALLKKALLLARKQSVDFRTIDSDRPLCRVVFSAPPPEARAPLMEWLPASHATPAAESLYIPHREIAAVQLAEGIAITSVQYVLLYFLAHWHMTQQDVYKNHYLDTLDMLNEGGRLTAAMPDRVAAASPFSLPVTTAGHTEASDSFLLIMGRFVKDTKVDVGRFPWAPFIPDVDNLPKNYYPHRSSNPPAFDYGSHALFTMDGK